jgi:hypothetical protein
VGIFNGVLRFSTAVRGQSDMCVGALQLNEESIERQHRGALRGTRDQSDRPSTRINGPPNGRGDSGAAINLSRLGFNYPAQKLEIPVRPVWTYLINQVLTYPRSIALCPGLMVNYAERRDVVMCWGIFNHEASCRSLRRKTLSTN